MKKSRKFEVEFTHYFKNGSSVQTKKIYLKENESESDLVNKIIESDPYKKFINVKYKVTEQEI